MLNDSILKATIVALEMRERVLQEGEGLELTKQALGLMRALQRGDAMASLWWIDDVKGLTEDFEGNDSVKVTDQEARAVLANVEHNHDAEIGINWDTLRYALDDVIAERGEDPNGGDGIDD